MTLKEAGEAARRAFRKLRESRLDHRHRREDHVAKFAGKDVDKL
jgi:hypothetical protein